ncbi:hypothetical protein, conserved [Eimeria brunetti]|uniref:Kringle domain-containing protein n=1 Tax=Eimeria brunetti TaxID=51314 RepID=U6LQT7_9EIME|nr:hypothetical protein, conserved [Eimeria brunetti]
MKGWWGGFIAGITRQYVQPASSFSVEYHARGVSPFKALRFFEGASETSTCGAPGLSLSLQVSLPTDEAGVFKETPEVVVEEGVVKKLVWKGIQLGENQHGSLLVCLCDFEFIVSSEKKETGTCTKPEDFNIHGGLLTISGFDASTKQVATYAPSSSGANETLFSLFVLHGGPTDDLKGIGFTLKEATESPCKGDTLAKSSQVSSFQAEAERQVVRGSGLLLRPGSSGELHAGTPLHICLETGDSRLAVSLFAGFATVGEFSVYQPWQVHEGRRQLGVPFGVHAVVLKPFSPLGLHWLQNDSQHVLKGDKETVFTKGVFSKTLTFEVYRDHVAVLLWRHDDMAPLLLATVQGSSWVSLTTDIAFERFYIFAAETGEQAAVKKYDARDLGLLLQQKPAAVSDESLHAPCCLFTVYEDTQQQQNPSVLLLDSKGGRFVWLKGDTLSLIQSRDNWQGLRSPLQHPTSLACLPRDKPEETGDTSPAIRTIGDALLAGMQPKQQQQQQQQPWGWYDCYIADRDGDRILHIEIDAANKQSSLVNEISYAGPQMIRLNRPIDLVAFKYHEETLLFVVQEGKASIDLLVPSREGLVDYHSSFQESQGVPLGTPSSVFLVEVGARGSGLDFARLGVYRTSLDTVLVQSVSLDATAVAPAFTYTHAAWFTVGDEVLLEPLIAGRISMAAFNSFHLNPNVPNFAYVSQIASVDKAKGTLSLQLLPSSSLSVEVGVVGQGVVNEVNSSISFFIAWTWKDTASNSGCLGTRCPANSSTTVTGATTAEERRCACNPGYVYDRDLDACILAGPGTFSPGGYRARAFACPPNTTTVPSAVGPFTSLQDCVCDKGFEPAAAETLGDSSSSAHRFREWLRGIPEYAGIGDSQICVPCGFYRYKETVSSSRCLPCPPTSYSSLHAPSSKRDCNLCLPGFYETESEDFICGQCPPGSFCVGSKPTVSSLLVYAGLKKQCAEHADTLPGTAENDHPFKCL